MSNVLRECYVCGLKAKTNEDLIKFEYGTIHHKYGRQNICRDCKNKRRRKGGIWDVSKQESVKIRANISNKKTIHYKDKKIYLKNNPRINICSNCLKRYPEELNRQIFLHHESYDDSNPIANTIELCHSCHTKYHLSLTPNNRFFKTKSEKLEELK